MIEMLNFTFAQVMDGADAEQRRKIGLAMEGRLGEGGGEIVDDPDLPPSMQGVEAPTWWNSDHDPFADQHTMGSDGKGWTGGLG